MIKGTREALTGGGTVAVVGTTPDYIHRLHHQEPGEILFIVDARFKDHPLLANIPPAVMLFVDTANGDLACGTAAPYLLKSTRSLQGIACFDCESLLLASRLASLLGLRFPSVNSIALARNKFESKQVWFSRGVPSPSAILTHELRETLNFFQAHHESIVLKPISGSGSELLFHCKSAKAVHEAVSLMEAELPRRRENPLFQPFPGTFEGRRADPCGAWVVEEFIPGPEFSCDFILQSGIVRLMRETGKVRATEHPFGSVLAYTFPPRYPAGFQKETLSRTLAEAVGALGFDWGYFMADYILRDGSPVILEVTPRPGGDSIPDLVKAACGTDLLRTYLDFVRGKLPSPPTENVLPPQSYASINLFARKEGKVVELDGAEISSFPGMRSFIPKKAVGDSVVLPPKDYDNRLLGYCIVALEPSPDIRSQALGLEGRLRVSIR